MKNVLVCPLNWGLGHATRCMPIIAELERQGAKVLIASDGRALELLKKEFPSHTRFEIPSYNIHYKSRFGFISNMVQQVPKFFKAVAKENKAIQQIVKENDIDIVVSDNRFGCLNEQTHNVFVTHQVKILLPWQWKIVDPLVFSINTNYIKKFDECWVPDVGTSPNLTAELSHSSSISKNPFFKYIGPVSRLESVDVAIKYEIFALISGPEPERSNLEKMLIGQMKACGVKGLIARGVPEGSNKIKALTEQIDIVDFLDSSGVAEAMCASEIVLSRSGYTTVMDLYKLKKKAIFIPTPGQTEQEMLANNLMDEGLFYTQNQKYFDLGNALAASEDYKGPEGIELGGDELEKVITELLINSSCDA